MRAIVVDGRQLEPPFSGSGGCVARLLTFPAVEVTTGVAPRDLLSLVAQVGEAEDDLLVVDGRLIAHGAAFRTVACDPRWSSALLVNASPVAGRCARAVLISEGGALLGLSSPLHRPLASPYRAEGVLRIAGGRVGEFAAGLFRLREQVGSDAFERAIREAPVEVLACAALSAGIVLHAVPARNLVAVRPEDDTERQRAKELLDSRDEERAWLANSVKARDGWFTTFLVSPYSRYVARWCARRGLSPDLVTAVSLVLGLAAAFSFGVGNRVSLVVGAIVLQVAFMLDCVDGQLARYSQRFSAFGSWFDSMADRAKEYLVYLGLAVGSLRFDDADVWGLALAAMAVQVLRHSLDLSFERARSAAVIGAAPDVVVEEAGDDGNREVVPVESTHEGRAGVQSTGHDRPSVVGWLRRILGLPIGERFAVISIGAAIATPRLVFLVLIVWGAASVAARSLLQLRKGLRSGRGLRWLVGVLPRIVEVCAVVAVAMTVGHTAALFAYLLAVAFRFYDASHRAKVLGPSSLSTPLRIVLDAWYLRVAVLLAGVLAEVLEPTAWLLASAVGLLTLTDLVMVWWREPRASTDQPVGDHHDVG